MSSKAQNGVYARNVTVGYSSSQEPISHIHTHEISFQMLYGELEVALKLEKYAKLAVARVNVSCDLIRVEEVEIWFNGQG